MALITFKGWEGQWWRKIKPVKAAVAAAGWVAPLKISLAVEAAKQVGLFSGIAKIGKGLVSKVGGRVAGFLPGGKVATGLIGAGSKLAKRIGRKNLKRIATGVVAGTIGAGAIAGSRGGGGGGGVMAVDPSTGALVGGGGRRRMNPGNVRAMRRAIRRVEMGARLYSKMFRISHGKSIKGAPGVKVVRFKRRAA